MHSCCSLPSCCTQASSSRLVRCCDDRVLGTVGGPVGVAHVGGRDLEPVPAALHVVEDDVAGDRDQPGADVAALERQRVDAAQRPHEGLARDVLGRRPVADPVVDVPVDHRHVVVVELAERLGVAGLGAVHQRPDVDARRGRGTSTSASSTSSVGRLRAGVAAVAAATRAGGREQVVRPGRRPRQGLARPCRSASRGCGHAGDRPPRRPADLDRLPPARPAGNGRACCGSGPMVTTSPQPVHASLPECTRLVLVGGQRRAAAPTEEMWKRQARRWPHSCAPRPAAAPMRPRWSPATERLTWAELDAAVDRAAAGYAAHGLAAGDRVAVQLPNGLDWLRAVARRPARRAGRRPGEHRLHRPRARVRARRLRRRAARRRRRPGTGRRASPSAPGRRTPTDRRPRCRSTPTAPSFLAYTSGTTGRPRGAILTAAALRANQEQCLAHDAAAGPRRRPRAAGAAAVPRLRPQRRLRPGRRHRRLRGAAGDLRPAGLARR